MSFGQLSATLSEVLASHLIRVEKLMTLAPYPRRTHEALCNSCENAETGLVQGFLRDADLNLLGLVGNDTRHERRRLLGLCATADTHFVNILRRSESSLGHPGSADAFYVFRPSYSMQSTCAIASTSTAQFIAAANQI